METHNCLRSSWINTPLGSMLAIADEKALYLLEFVNRKGLERKIERLKDRTKLAIVPGKTEHIISIELELEKYFKGELKEFKTPIFLLGTTFQKMVWNALIKIPIGQTCSYLDIAKAVNNPKAFRAVALTNGSNQLALIVPCHRVIKSNGDLCGYGAGVERKQWLINHEKQVVK